MPSLFQIADPESKLIGAHLHKLGGIVVADPADLLHTVGALDGEDLPITTHTVDWTTTVSWEPTEPAVARGQLALALTESQRLEEQNGDLSDLVERTAERSSGDGD